MYPRAIPMASTANSVTISSAESPQVRPSAAFFVSFIDNNKMGKSKGMLRMAISTVLLPALEAIADIIVRTEEMPIEAKITIHRNNRESSSG